MFTKKLILLPSALPWKWSTDYHQQTALTLAKNDNIVVCYITYRPSSFKEYLQKKHFQFPIKKRHANVFTIESVAWLPFQRFNHIKLLNKWIDLQILRAILFIFGLFFRKRQKLFWFFEPTFAPMLDVFNSNHQYLTICDCVDFWDEELASEDEKAKTLAEKKTIYKKADFMFVNSRQLYKLHKAHRKQLDLVPQGFRIDLFKSFRPSKPKLQHKKPIIGYIGGINFRLDYELINQLALRNNDLNFVLVGTEQDTDNDYFKNHVQPQLKLLKKRPNVIFTGYVDKEAIPQVISEFDICIIPYNSELQFNQNCFPMKLFEYLYVGKPIISSPIIELNHYRKYLRIANTLKEWEADIRWFLKHAPKNEVQKQMRLLSAKHSWDKKINAISNIVEGKHK